MSATPFRKDAEPVARLAYSICGELAKLDGKKCTRRHEQLRFVLGQFCRRAMAYPLVVPKLA